jgi:hypothetical protein
MFKWTITDYVEHTQYLRVYLTQLRHKLEKDPARPRFLINLHPSKIIQNVIPRPSGSSRFSRQPSRTKSKGWKKIEGCVTEL